MWVKLKYCPKKCSFPSPLDLFWLNMTSLTENFILWKFTPLYKNEQNEREIIQCQCQSMSKSMSGKWMWTRSLKVKRVMSALRLLFLSRTCALLSLLSMGVGQGQLCLEFYCRNNYKLWKKVFPPAFWCTNNQNLIKIHNRQTQTVRDRNNLCLCVCVRERERDREREREREACRSK